MNLKGSSTPAPAPEQSPAVVSSTPTQAAGQQPVASITGQIKMLNDGNYPAPSVFPSKRQFDVSIFKSPEFLSLKSQQLPTPAPEEFGGDSFNPFRSNLKK